jgi:hypothetical protein
MRLVDPPRATFQRFSRGKQVFPGWKMPDSVAVRVACCGA